jgi:hypothetical protein
MHASDSDLRLGTPAWASGLGFIALGAVFLLVNLGVLPSIGNWWALFILIPAIVLAGSAWTRYQVDRALTPRVTGPLFAALFPLSVALIFLLNLDLGRAWPIFIILPGLGLLFSARARS